MSIRTANVNPLFFEDFQALALEQGTDIIYAETRLGIEVYAKRADRVYQLYKRDRSPRLFQSGQTARTFARDQLRVSRFAWECLNHSPHPPFHSHNKRSLAHDNQ